MVAGERSRTLRSVGYWSGSGIARRSGRLPVRTRSLVERFTPCSGTANGTRAPRRQSGQWADRNRSDVEDRGAARTKVMPEAGRSNASSTRRMFWLSSRRDCATMSHSVASRCTECLAPNSGIMPRPLQRLRVAIVGRSAGPSRQEEYGGGGDCPLSAERITPLLRSRTSASRSPPRRRFSILDRCVAA